MPGICLARQRVTHYPLCRDSSSSSIVVVVSPGPHFANVAAIAAAVSLAAHPPRPHAHTHTDRTPTHAYRTHGAPSPDVCQSACFCTHACAHVPGQPLNAHTRAPSPRGREQEIVSVRACKLKVNGSSEIIWLTRAGAYYAIARFCHTQDLRSMELGSEIALSAPYPMHRLSASFSLTRDYLFLHFLPASC